MAKKSKPSGKAESKAPVKEETAESGEDGGIIDFFYLFNGIGILIGIIYIIFGIFHYVFPIL